MEKKEESTLGIMFVWLKNFWQNLRRTLGARGFFFCGLRRGRNCQSKGEEKITQPAQAPTTSKMKKSVVNSQCKRDHNHYTVEGATTLNF